ncbi:MAG: hypothetical protein K2R98_07315 [Gemmataceae bacterium]|nr:hypothetical protein [Gemmataceae bacterium]
MARAYSRGWVRLALGVILALLVVETEAGRSQDRPSRAHNALTSGIDLYRRGEYEFAAKLFEQAEIGKEDLSATEQQELSTRVQQNSAALKSRRDGTEQLRKADEAFRGGRVQEASDLLKEVTGNQFLSTADRQRAQQLTEQLRPRGSGPSQPVAPPESAAPLARARAKLQQARALLVKNDFAAAEALASEADALGAAYTPGEDTPRKIRDDITKAKAVAKNAGVKLDAKGMLAAGRTALEQGDLDKAEQYAKDADKAESAFSMHLWGDSPTKLLKDVQTARTKQVASKPPTPTTPRTELPKPSAPRTGEGVASVPPPPVWPKDEETTPKPPVPTARPSTTAATTPPKPTTPVASVPTTPKPTTPVAGAPTTPARPSTPVASAPSTVDSNPQAARDMLKDARKALQDGNAAKARELAEQAAKKRPNLEWWEDNPDKVLADVRRIEAKTGTAPGATASAAAAQTGEKQDAHVLLRQAREKYNEGKLEEAKDLCQRAASAPTSGWGLFEDNPDKLRADILKQRTKRDQEEAARVLVEARRLCEKGQFDEAEKMADRARHLHGPYSIWDLGDRPEKVVADAQAGRSKSKPIKLPPPPDTAIVQNTPTKKPDVTPPGTGAKPPAVVANTTPTGPLTPPGTGVVQGPATTPGTGVGTTPTTSPFGPATGTTPTTTVAQVPTTTSFVPTTGTPVVPTTGTPVAPVADLAKQNAKRLVAEARVMQKEGRLIEALQKVQEAQKSSVAFGPDEDSPERALMDLRSVCNTRIQGLVQGATTAGQTGQAEQLRKAESDLVQARMLAVGFGLDTIPIDQKAEWVKQSQASVAAGTPPALLNVPSTTSGVSLAQHEINPQQQRGLDLLAKARLELKSGNEPVARRLAEEAFSGPYLVRKEAEDMLRQCDVEAFNQRQLAAKRSFDAGVAAYKRKDFGQAVAIFKEIDARLLPPTDHSRMKDYMLSPDMKPFTSTAVAQATPPAVTPGTPGTGNVTVVRNDQPADSYQQQVGAMQEIKFQQMREMGLAVQKDATDRFQAGDVDRAFEILGRYRTMLEDSNLEPDRLTLLRRPIEARAQQFKTLKAQKEFEQLMKSKSTTVASKQAKEALVEQEKNRQVKELVSQYNQFRKEGKYREAEMAAVKARELDPDSPAIDAMIYSARILRNQNDVQTGKRNREDHFTSDLNNAEDPGPVVNTNEPVSFNSKDWKNRVGKRDPLTSQLIGKKTDKDREIERRLNGPINLEFKDTPLHQVVDDLRVMSGMNIVTDKPALDEEGISLDRPLSVKLEGIAMKSALNILLHQVHLTYVIKDEVLQITTERHARGKLVQRTFPVADLIIPVDNYIVPNAANFMKAISQGPMDNPNLVRQGSTPAMRSMLDGQGVGTPGGDRINASTSTTSGGSPSTIPQAGFRGPGQTNTMEELLIKLITNNIMPQSWSDVGGPGTIDFFPLGMALVINQTPDVQEQVQELLDALRRLQDLEVSVEVRMISLSEAFFERIGMDFQLNLKTDASTKTLEPQIVTQQFKPLNYINDLNGRNQIVGLQPGASGGSFSPGLALTPDLDVPIRSSSFQYAIPPFGGYPGIPGADGGLSMGLAFLSDIQVFMFMEAAQGDKRMNVMQAPKLTLFNGQTSTIQIQDFQYFITNVQVVQSGGQIAFVPQNQPIPLGVNLAVQAVVSADRRFVRLNLAPTLTNLASALVPLFPITTFITPVFEGGAQGQPVPFTQFIQQPTFTSVTIQTTVSVPDGGTVLLGGLKLLNEGRNEFGPPVLSKIPYINRLFKNVGYGRDTSSLLIMVTPRIIINAEEEERQTGVRSGGPGGTGEVGGLGP